MLSQSPRRILFATDFSACSRDALASAALLARQLGGSVHILYVSRVPPQLAGDERLLGDEFVDADIEKGRVQVEATIGKLKRSGVDQCGGEVVPGYVAADVILERAKSGNFDLVVVGTHGNSGLKRMWLGSVAERIIRECSLPVMTVRSSSAEADDEDAAERAPADATAAGPRAIVERINAAWREGRAGKAAALFHRDVVLLKPSRERVVGIEAMVRSYEEFAAAASVEEYAESDHTVDVFGPTAVVGYHWRIAWRARGESFRESGRDIFVLTLGPSGWQVAWRTRLPTSGLPAPPG